MSIYTNNRVSDFSQRYQEYVNKIEGKSNTPGGSPEESAYKYYNFIPSPDAVTLTEIGRCLSSDILGIKSTADSHVLWKPLPGTNTPEGWKMQMGQKISEHKRAEMGLATDKSSRITTATPGLDCKITLISTNPDEADNQYVNHFKQLGIMSNSAFLDKCIVREYDAQSVTWIDRFLLPAKVSHKTRTTDFSQYSKIFGLPAEKKQLDSQVIGVEWTGYFKPPVLGEYTFALDSGSGFCLLWAGNKSICEYIPKNADINVKTNPFTILVSEDRYYPIRIQYYANSNADPNDRRAFSFKIKNEGTGSQLDLTQCLFTLNDGAYFPRLLYCSFVSKSQADFQRGKFDCYAMDSESETDADCAAFYKFVNSTKYTFSTKENDYDNVSGVMQYGTLKDGHQYTDVSVSTNPNSMPVTFSVYRVDADIRMNKAFQINTERKADTNTYEMALLDMNFKKGTSYDTLPNYYPENPTEGVNVKNPNECKKRCNDLPDCNYFYTYKSKDTPRCLVGTNNKPPVFSQIAPVGPDALSSVDENTSSLYLRTMNFPKVTGCGTNAVFVNSDQDIQNTVDYSNSFPYSNYLLSKKPITNHMEVGKCSDSEFLNLENEARNILYAKTNYQNDGEYAHPDGSMRFAKYPSTDDRNFWNSIKLQEGMDTKNTNAVNDTLDNIRDVKAKENNFAAKQVAINKNLYDLSNNMIPDYLNQQKKMNNNINSDLSGNSLLYFRSQRIPTLREQTAFDANEGGVMQNSLYVLGTMTAATLLILAVLLARE